MIRRLIFAFISIAISITIASSIKAAETIRPNVLFIAMDDLNDWIGCMGGHPQTITPNLDRLAKSGVLFTNAHCAAPACNPSRISVFSGIAPNVSGVYANNQVLREVLPDVELLPKSFSKNGYRSTGSGKMLHYIIDAQSWDDYFPEPASEMPIPHTLYPDKRPVSLPRAGPWQYVETDWGALETTDQEFGGDFTVSQWVSEQLAQKHDNPFFLACGIYRPHEPWFVPAKYFEPFPLESILIPPGYKEDDLADLPPEGQRQGPNRYFAHIQKQGQWKHAIQSYLASIHFADAMLGRVLDALDNSEYADNTIVVLWSDHGWHLGEKQHWQKYTAWRVCTRIPLMIRVPKNCPGLPEGTSSGICNQPVNLVSLAPTLFDLCGLPPSKVHDGPSLTPLLKDVDGQWPHVSVTCLHNPGDYGLSDNRWRYIHYANGDEELYDIAADRYEWNNLAADPKYADKLAELRAKGPTSFASKPEPSIQSLNKLTWVTLGDDKAPPSRPDGSQFPVFFINQSEAPVKLYWVDRMGQPKFYEEIQPTKTARQATRPGAIWQITNLQDKPLGYFKVDDRSAQAIIPAH
ncbi:iduronate-2-sulfatase [Blastopirellula marina]|uniref:Iduronate-2-sulfatase n=1 Tax=Blastopirellula marina TaxID=124 RepID=A0A2S8FXH9_9BACT|nr:MULTISPECIES: sulfatase-like hydrolase/transferase [Pirellulaceae]PQO36770.1 iduronate-2-sulfatase [Blastopirellula marina]RCS53485.1 iduronate-2-sulfatase [Bremerella cremea]